MNSERRERLLFIAFTLYWVFSYLMIILLRNNPNPERFRQASVFSSFGMICGSIFMPFILPMKKILQNGKLSIYRILPVLLMFLPGIILRITGFETWRVNPVVYIITNFFTGICTTVIFGLFICLCNTKRIFRTCLSLSIGLFVFNIITELMRMLPLLPWNEFLFYFSGLIIITIGILVFLCLYQIDSAGRFKKDSSDAAKKPMLSVYCLLPAAAILVISWTNTFTEQLFIPVMQLPFHQRVNLPMILPIIVLPFLGYLADIRWMKFLKLCLPICAALFLLTPSLLLHSESSLLFFILYSFTTLAIFLLYMIFPFIIMSLYKSPGGWCWFLAVFVHMMRTSITGQAGFFRSFSIGIEFEVIILSLSAIAFYALSCKSLNLLHDINPVNARLELSSENNYKSHNLTDREVQVARLLLQGLNNDEIKNRLTLSLSSVKLYIGEIFKKYGVKSRAEFIASFVRD